MPQTDRADEAAGSSVKPLTHGMRSPVVAPLTRFALGVPLLLLSTMTDRFFAWTILPPLTAAFLGANYWSSALMALLASRRTTWAEGRVAASVALVFAPLTLAATLLHLGKFRLHTAYGWIWLIAYAVYPPMLGVLLARQLRTPGGDPPRWRPLPVWARVVLGIHAVALIPLAVALFVSPTGVGKAWPWTLTPLTGQITAAWVLAFGVLAALQLRENDLRRSSVCLWTYPVFALLQAVGLLRFGADMAWSRPSASLYVAFLASALALGSLAPMAARGRIAPSAA
ncbi:MAG TPA: hypothetical protein DIU14_09595 [Actinobacteria bacterium]|nr:hypothetical protein [Actinomycetota bacterium]